MTQLATTAATPAPAASAQPIDRRHLSRMTFGDRSLEREVLQLFDRQSSMLIARMRGGEGAAVSGLAHTLKGSASGIGAWHVANAAEAVELAADRSECGSALNRLAATVDEARATIAELIRAH